MALFFIEFGGLQAGQYLFSQPTPRHFRQSAPFVKFDRGAAVEDRHHRTVNHTLAKFFHHVEDQTRLAGAVGVQETGIGIKPGQHQRPLHLAIEDAIAIVERTVKGIGCPLGHPPRPAHLGQQQVTNPAPISTRRPPFNREQLAAAVVNTLVERLDP